MNRRVYGLTGLPCSGKGALGKMLAEQLNAPLLVYGDILREELARRGKEATRENLQRLAIEWREKSGDAVLARELIKQIGSGPVVVDGFRSPAEVRAFREAFGNDFVLVFVDAPLELRFERAKARNRAGGPGSLQEFGAADEREARSERFGILACAKMADARVNNSGSLEELSEKARCCARSN